MQFDAPKGLSWPNRFGAGFFVFIYDWDWITLGSDYQNILNIQVQLCTSIFPCALSIRGDLDSQRSIHRKGNGSFTCQAGTGCSSVLITSMQFHCDQNMLSTNSAFEISGVGTLLSIQSSFFFGCLSATDGAFVRSFDGASIYVNNSTFQDGHSLGAGGAVSSFGGSLSLVSSNFVNCSSILGGGAVSVADFACYGTNVNSNTSAQIDSCTFQGCSSQGVGGALWASSFAANVRISSSVFVACSSANAGGAVALTDSATVNVKISLFLNNSAYGVGGGAIYSQNSKLGLQGVSCNRNVANNGGGGAVYWQGIDSPIFGSWCTEGYYSDPSNACTPTSCISKCVKCRQGHFRSMPGALKENECSLCEPGKFSSILGATVCIDCGIGTFSTEVGATVPSACVPCSPGSYSVAWASTQCLLCQLGTYSGATNSTGCTDCETGTYSGAIGSTLCTSCDAGTFSNAMATSCSECNFGTYSSFEASSCISCLAGTYSTVGYATNNASCAACIAGSFSEPGASECSSCPVGTFSSCEGMTSLAGCVDCDAGRYSVQLNSNSSASCQICSGGTYSSQGASTCDLCPSGTLSTLTGATSPSVCYKCNPGFFSGPGSSHCLNKSYFRHQIPITIHDNEQFLTEVLPFEFKFCCSVYESANITVNGQIIFGSTTQSPVISTNIISAFGPQYAQFMDIVPEILVMKSEIETSFQWTFHSTTSNYDLTFQISLFANNSIFIAYIDIQGVASVDGSFIGISSEDGAVQIYLDSNKLYTGLCVHLFPNQSDCSSYILEYYRCPDNIIAIPICPPGQYLDVGIVCLNCEAGKYQTGTGMIFPENCSSCEPGKFSEDSGATSPENCSIDNSSGKLRTAPTSMRPVPGPIFKTRSPSKSYLSSHRAGFLHLKDKGDHSKNHMSVHHKMQHTYHQPR